MAGQVRIAVESRPTCYLCGRAGELLYCDLKDNLFGVSGDWSFKKCSDTDCGLIWLDPIPTPDDIGKTYQNYYTHTRSNHARHTLSARLVLLILRPISIGLLRMRSERKRYKAMFLDQMPTGDLLEVGCGSGKRLARMKALGWNVTGQEIDPVAAQHLRENEGIDVHLGPLETLQGCEEKFDVVIMSHVIEHVPDPVALLTASYKRLKKGGLLVIATPNAASYGHQKFGASWRGLEPPRHLHLFTCGTLTQVAKNAGFNRLNCQTTVVSAYGIGEGSQLSISRTTGDGGHTYTSRDVLRGVWFQMKAHRVFQEMKDSGEECVLMATK